jgi:hypothetical protein
MDDAQVDRPGGMARFSFVHNNEPHRISIPITGGKRVACNQAKVYLDIGHMRTIKEHVRVTLGKMKYGQEVSEFVAKTLDMAPHSLSFAEWTEACMTYLTILLCELPGFQGPARFLESRIPSVKTSGPSNRILSVVKLVGGTAYYTGSRGSPSRDYLDEVTFAAEGIKILEQQFYTNDFPVGLGDRTFLETWARYGLTGMLDILNRGTLDNKEVT